MQVVWEANTADFARRKRAARACATCQKRKKRCHHTFSKDLTGDDDDALFDERAGSALAHKEPVRFVGDLNAESILRDLSSRSKGTPRESKLGTWMQAAPEVESHHVGPETPAARVTPAAERYRQVERGRRTVTGHQKNYLQAAGAFRTLPQATQNVLMASYIASIDGVLPIVDGGRVLREWKAGTASQYLVQAICLVACKTKEAERYLRLTEDGPLMDPIPFARALHTGLDAAMKADLEYDRLTKVQILTLMSLHNDGPGGFEESSMHLLQAIHEAITAGLHILTAGRHTHDEASYAWWSIWVLDKINACLGGRPIMIADRDMGLPRPEPIPDPHSRNAALRMLLALADILCEVISYYRPTADQDATGWEEGFPSFQEVTFRSEVAFKYDVPLQSHRDLLELFYNVIAVVACHAGGPTTASYKRRIVAADRIQELITSCGVHHHRDEGSHGSDDNNIPCAGHENNHAEHLPPLPLVPYAVSLSLTVAYRLIRDRASSTDFAQAKRDLAVRCSLLEGLSKRWWSADAMAKLGRKALKSLKSRPDPGHEQEEANLVGGLMEAEVAVCKYGPFAQGVQAGALGAQSQNNETNLNGQDQTFIPTAENALDVLSSAAATHGNQQTPYLGKGLHDANGIPTTATNPAYPTPTDSTSNPSEATIISNSMAPLVDGFPSALNGHNHSHGSILLGPSTTTGNASYSKSASAQHIDSLFEDFFDVGMPTFFEDPLFGGDEFWHFPVFGDGEEFA